MIDLILSLFILLLTFSTSFDLLINTRKMKERVIYKVTIELKESECYEKTLSELF